MMTKRGCGAIESAFALAKQENRSALITYLTVGYPTPEETVGLALAMQQGGADIIELGVPFSDPVADGPTIQAASQVALTQGVTPQSCLEQVRAMRAAGVTVPLLLMGYYNPVLSYGEKAYVMDAKIAGADGLIIPDLPPDEAAALQDACSANGLALVHLVAPTTDSTRLPMIARETSGFLYVVARLGTTGHETIIDDALADRLAQIKASATTPVAIGFGIREPAQAVALSALAEGIIVGSAVVDKAASGADTLEAYVAALRAAV